MSDMITVTGIVATDPEHKQTSGGTPYTRFRLASTQRRFDRAKASWVDGETNWYTVTGFRRLGDHLASSLKRTDRVIVRGKLRVRDWESGDKRGTAVDIDAETVGHDLFWGTSQYQRAVVKRSSEEVFAELSPEPAEHDLDSGGWSNAAPAAPAASEGAVESSSVFGDSTPLVQHFPEEATVNS